MEEVYYNFLFMIVKKLVLVANFEVYKWNLLNLLVFIHLKKNLFLFLYHFIQINSRLLEDLKDYLNLVRDFMVNYLKSILVLGYFQVFYLDFHQNCHLGLIKLAILSFILDFTYLRIDFLVFYTYYFNSLFFCKFYFFF